MGDKTREKVQRDNMGNFIELIKMKNMKKLYVILALTLMEVSGYAQLKVTQSIRYYKDATFEKSPTMPAADGPNKAISLQQARDSFFVKQDTVSLYDYISGADNQIARFRGDTAVTGIPNGVEGSLMKIISGVPAWGSGGALSSIQEATEAPVTGNVYLHSTSHKLWVKAGGYWHSVVWASDSVEVAYQITKTIVDAYDALNRDGSHAIANSAVHNDALGQCFTPSASGDLQSVVLSVIKYGSPTGNAFVKLYAITGTYGTDATATGTVLATSDNFDVSMLPSEQWGTYEITFSGTDQYPLLEGTRYAVMIEYAGGDADNYIEVGVDSSSPTHSGNHFAYDGGYFWGFSAEDACFEVWADISSEPLATVAPTVTTQNVTDITTTTATGNGTITSTGGENASEWGVCFMAGTSGDPTTANSKTYDTGSAGIGGYTTSFIGGTGGASIRARAYAINSAGTGYGTTVQFQFLSIGSLATVETQAVTDITTSTATGNGIITDLGDSDVTEWGICFMVGQSGDPTIANSKTSQTGEAEPGAYTADFIGGTSGVYIRARAYATNGSGTSYGTTVQFQFAQ